MCHKFEFGRSNFPVSTNVYNVPIEKYKTMNKSMKNKIAKKMIILFEDSTDKTQTFLDSTVNVSLLCPGTVEKNFNNV